MSTALEAQLTEELKACMKAGDKVGLAAVRMIRTKIMEKRTAKVATEITDEVIVDVIRNYVKQMQGSIQELVDGGADEDEDNIVQMKAEIAYLDRFLPKLLDEEATRAIVEEVLAREGITDPKMFGKATGLIMKDYKGKVDPGLVSKLIKAKLG